MSETPDDLIASEWREYAEKLEDLATLQSRVVIGVVSSLREFAESWDRADFEKLAAAGEVARVVALLAPAVVKRDYEGVEKSMHELKLPIPHARLMEIVHGELRQSLDLFEKFRLRMKLDKVGVR